MIKDIIDKEINMLIVKDLSRLTRDKNKTGYYTEIFFPDNDVRFISVNENIDSGEVYEIDDSIMLRGIVNQSYLADLSKKVKAVKTSMKKDGKYVEVYVPYGYKKDEKDKYKVVIDENVADNIKLIFEMYIAGYSQMKIANHLSNLGIDTCKKYKGFEVPMNKWRSDSISRILKDPFYTGRMIINKAYTNYITKKIIKTPKEEWQFLENHHEALITDEQYQMVQENLEKKYTKPKQKYDYLLRELVHCGHCRARMQYKYRTRTKVRGKKIVNGKKDWYYKCRMIYRYPEICDKGHTIKEEVLNEIIINSIKERFSKININKVTGEIKDKYKETSLSYKLLKKYKLQEKKIENKVSLLYNKKCNNEIDVEIFKTKYIELKNEVQIIKDNIKELEIREEEKLSDINLKLIIEDFKKAKKIDNRTIKKIIRRIEVFEDFKVNIIWNF